MAYRVIKKKINHDDTSPVTIHTTGSFEMVLWCVVHVPEIWDNSGSGGKSFDVGVTGTTNGFIAVGDTDLEAVSKHGLDSSERGSFLYDSTNEGVLHKGFQTATGIIATFVINGATQGECDVYLGIEYLSNPP